MARRKWEGEHPLGQGSTLEAAQVKLATRRRGLQGEGEEKKRRTGVLSWVPPLDQWIPTCAGKAEPKNLRGNEGIIVDFVFYRVGEKNVICYKYTLKYYRKIVRYIEFALIYFSKHKYMDKYI